MSNILSYLKNVDSKIILIGSFINDFHTININMNGLLVSAIQELSKKIELINTQLDLNVKTRRTKVPITVK